MRPERISKVIQTEATTPGIGDFLLTHVPFENLYLDANAKKAIPDTALLDQLLASPQEHKFILVQGGNGSGKSHLIRWLKEKYVSRTDPAKEAVLLISRAHNTLQDALAQLLESDVFPQEVREQELKAIKDAKSPVTGEELKELVNFNFTLEIMADEGNQSAPLEPRYREWLREYLQNPYIKKEFLLTATGPIERIRRKIETVSDRSVVQGDDPAFVPSDFAITLSQISGNLKNADRRAAEVVIRLAEKLADDVSGSALRQKVADYLNTKVSGVVRRSMNLKSMDFQKLFASLRKILKAKGMGLTLFVEDINSFTGIDEALMEVLLTDHRAQGNHEYCRLASVVGSTNAFYRDKLNASIKDRIHRNIYITDQSVLGSAQQLSRFAAKYINAIRLSDEQVTDWLRRGANDEDTPVYPEEHEWAQTDCFGIKISLFPFNETALWKLFSVLPQEKKTPRVLLKSILAHVLKMWCVQADAILDSEDNFANEDIALPRWESPLYSEANDKMGLAGATRRGVLLRLWGDGTTNRQSGRLGGLTADLFQTFHVAADIQGMPGPTAQAAAPQQTVVVPPPPPPAPAAQPARPARLLELERELDGWLSHDAVLTNHIQFRDWLLPFLTSCVDWELEGVPMYLVDSTIGVRSRIHIEGQPIAVGEGFVLPRTQESKSLLLALANMRLAGQNTWRFPGGNDYLTAASAWLERHRQELVACAIAPRNQAARWDLPLWNLAAVYCVKTLFGGVDIHKTSEELAVELLAAPPDFTDDAVHSPAWQELKTAVLGNADYKDRIYKDALAYFSKSVGSAEAGGTGYTFVDADALIRQIKRLRSMQWNLDGLCPADVPAHRSPWYYAANFLNHFTGKTAALLDAEHRQAQNYLSFFGAALDGNFDEPAVTDTVKAMKDFLAYLTGELNLGYTDEDFKALKPGTAAKRLTSALDEVGRLEKPMNAPETLMRLAKSPFDEIEKFHAAFLRFNALLDEKDKLFSGSVDTASRQAIAQYKADVLLALDAMERQMDQREV